MYFDIKLLVFFTSIGLILLYIVRNSATYSMREHLTPETTECKPGLVEQTVNDLKTQFNTLKSSVDDITTRVTTIEGYINQLKKGI